MTIIQKLLKILGLGKSEVPLRDIVTVMDDSSGRRHHRHLLMSFSNIFLVINQKKIPLKDISYGGLSLASKVDWLRPYTDRDQCFMGNVVVFDENIEIKMEIRFSREGSTGCMFVDPEDFSRPFLEGIISFMDAGISLVKMPNEAMPRPFNEPAWQNFSGHEGTLKVQVRTDNEIVVEVLVGYVLGKYNYQVHFANGQVSISSSKRKFPPEEKKITLKKAIFVLIGLNQINSNDSIKDVINFGSSLLVR